MDTTRLKATTSQNRDFAAAGPVNIKTTDGALIASTMNPDNGRDNAKDAAEIVRRWNAFPALFEALELLSGDTVQQAGHFDLAQKSARALLQSLKA